VPERTVAALYIDPRGPYPLIEGVEVWDETRNALAYDGPWPVVAHPPCGPWGHLRHLCTRQDPRCALAAVYDVRRYGGVLEHPADSRLWEHEGLPLPGAPPDEYGGRTIVVCQVEWGHVARKRTWLYLVGVPDDALRPPPFPGREPTHWISGRRGQAHTTPVPAGIRVASAEQRRRTPPAFAEYLVALARSVRA
jgi:hypothetical protein